MFGNLHVSAQTSSSNFNTKAPSWNLFCSQTQTLTREKEEIKDSVQKELDNKTDELTDPPKLELGNTLINLLGAEADDFLENKFVNKKEQEDAVLELVKEEYNFNFEFWEFIDFLLSDRGQNLMANNSISMHIESGNISYQNFNTNENICNFILAQQDKTKSTNT